MALSLENLSIGRGGAVLARNLSFRVEPGQILALTGPNGSGKTTFLRVLAGLLKPLEGRVDNTDPLHWVGTDNALKSDLTVQENMEFWRKILTPLSGSIDDALDRLTMRANARRLVRHLSAGQKRRVALSRLFLSSRPLWLLDEPATGLDADSAAQISALVRAHTAQGGLAVIATHEPALWQATHEFKFGAAVTS